MACCTRPSGTPAVQPCCAAGDGQPLAPPQSSARLPQMVLALAVLPVSCAPTVAHRLPSPDAPRIAPPPLARSAVLLI
jgi:hypothetical protein